MLIYVSVVMGVGSRIGLGKEAIQLTILHCLKHIINLNLQDLLGKTRINVSLVRHI